MSATVESHWYQKAIDAPEDVISLVEQVVRIGGEGLRPTDTELQRSAQTILDSWTRRQSVFTERDLIFHAAQLFPGGATVDELTSATKVILAAGQTTGDVITVIPKEGWDRPGTLPGELRFTTRAQLEREALVLNAVTQTSPTTVDGATLEKSIASRRLVDEQAAAVRYLSQVDSQLVAMVGPGGSGNQLSQRRLPPSSAANSTVAGPAPSPSSVTSSKRASNHFKRERW